MKSTTALAIVTFVDASRPRDVGRRLPDALASLERTGYRGATTIVDDGSTCIRHRQYLDELEGGGRYRVIRRAVNGGISRAKNTALRAIAETGADIGFLAEDDVLFFAGWEDAYIDAMQRSGLQHFSWYLPDEANCVVACNGVLVTMTANLLGLLLTFTSEVLERVGGFKVLPHRYGYEHIHWTSRIILAGLAPFAADIVHSNRFVGRNRHPSSLSPLEIAAGSELNRRPGYEIGRIWEPLLE